jgi:hypothetical protein
VFVRTQARLLSNADADNFTGALTACARAAGLAGTVVLAWPGGFRAPQSFHPFFRSAPYELLAASINKKLSCSNL